MKATTSKKMVIAELHLNDNIDNQIEVLYFNYKTYMNEVYKVKQLLLVLVKYNKR